MFDGNPGRRRLVLASGSPRRREMIAGLGCEFSIASADIDESVLPSEAAADYVERLARDKAKTVFEARKDQQDIVVLGADTTVVAGGDILGKPVDFEDAQVMLRRLSGTWHEVLTSVALVAEEGCKVTTTLSRVRFRELSEQEIQRYWDSGEPADKAGAYGIQGLAGSFVERVEGSYSSIVGLPLCETVVLLKEFGIKIWSD
ncbi:Maf family protein [Hahella sp. NBU794]|uniref:Maf family protein n=1 Tax=Hahella sp. NBU794 TaxID=3422590 RepID=UPI003D6EE0F6